MDESFHNGGLRAFTLVYQVFRLNTHGYFLGIFEDAQVDARKPQSLQELKEFIEVKAEKISQNVCKNAIHSSYNIILTSYFLNF